MSAAASGAASAPAMRWASTSPTAQPTFMSVATAQRRIVWNATGLALLWGIAAVWPASVDVYYHVLDQLVVAGHLEVGTDELIDATVLWTRCALTIVFLFNIAEALLTRHAPPIATCAPPTPTPTVGEALARSMSQPTTGPARLPTARKVSPVTPVPGASAMRPPSPLRPPSVHSSPFRAGPIGLGRPSSTPFQARSSTPSGALPRAPSTPYAVSRSPSLAASLRRSPSPALQGVQPSPRWSPRAPRPSPVQRAWSVSMRSDAGTSFDAAEPH